LPLDERQVRGLERPEDLTCGGTSLPLSHQRRLRLLVWPCCRRQRKRCFHLAFPTRRLAYLALLMALTVVLTRYASVRLVLFGVEGVRIGFGHFPVLMAGVLYGPLAGAIVGGASDLIGYFLSPLGPYMPHFTVIAMLTGALPALLLAALRLRRRGTPSLAHLVIAIASTQVACAVFLTPLCLKMLFGMPLAATMIPRVIAQAILIPVYVSLMQVILRSVGGLAPVWEKANLVTGDARVK